MNINYQKELEKILNKITTPPNLLIHACCGICASYVLEYLTQYFNITVLYYNPNTYPEEEFNKRLEVLKTVINKINKINKITLKVINYNNLEFENEIKGLEQEKEGGYRCTKCFNLRLNKTAQYATKYNFDYFTTTLSISPYKNSKLLNEIGHQLELQYNIKYLYSDFKKKNGYKRSLEIANQYHLYRQNYCGCRYSLLQKNIANK